MKILVLSPVDEGAIRRLRRVHDVVCAIDSDRARLEALVRDRQVLIFRSGVEVDADLMRCAPDLRLVVRAGSGFDNIDLDYAARRGIEFVRIAEPGARAVAELTFGLMLALARNIVRTDALWRNGRWVKHAFEGHLLRGKVLGIVGAGGIGSCVGELAAAWGMDVVGCVGRPSGVVAAALKEKGIELAPFDQVVSAADFLSVHVPLKESTRHLIDARVLGRMKRGSFLVNMARGGVVDEGAVRRELLEGERLIGAAFDVHEAEGEGRVSPLADLPNVVLTPHIGSSTVDTQREIGERMVSIIDSFGLRREPAPSVRAALR